MKDLTKKLLLGKTIGRADVEGIAINTLDLKLIEMNKRKKEIVELVSKYSILDSKILVKGQNILDLGVIQQYQPLSLDLVYALMSLGELDHVTVTSNRNIRSTVMELIVQQLIYRGYDETELNWINISTKIITSEFAERYKKFVSFDLIYSVRRESNTYYKIYNDFVDDFKKIKDKDPMDRLKDIVKHVIVPIDIDNIERLDSHAEELRVNNSKKILDELVFRGNKYLYNYIEARIINEDYKMALA